ncbi:MAG: AMP-binding protein [Acidobacteriaceae bacterium]|nr:AMP-binding protein [Acidobacteriaceae bacterium]
MRIHAATYLDDFRRFDRETAIVRYRGIRRVATSYGEIARLAGRFAAYLTLRGVRPGDRVLLWAENSAEWIAAFHGCVLCGALVVPLDAYGTLDFAQRVCMDVRPSLVVGDAALLRQLPVEWPRLSFENWAAELPEQEAGPVAGISPETPLQILFTSGTTGNPKGIVHTHGNILASVSPIEDAAQRYLRYERLVHPLRFLHTLPLSHVFGQMMGLWVPPIFGAEVYFENRLVAPRLIETIRRERISVLAAVPRVFSLLKTHLEMARPGLAQRISAAQDSSVWLRWWHFRDVHAAFGIKFWALISGGGALPESVEQFWNALGFVLVQGYGMTETTALITLNHPFHVVKGSIGKALPGREVKLAEDGELLVRGPMIANATWSNGALHSRTEEWLRTGDLVETKPSGEFKFIGRKSEVIVTAAGVNLHPEDIEAAIEQESGVRACAVVATETASGPEPCAVLAFCGTRQQAETAVQRANARLAEQQQVSRWEQWPEPDLPRTSTGKVRRKAVAMWLAERMGAASPSGAASLSAGSDWLLNLVVQITGEAYASGADELRLSEDLHIDSLGRVQLAAAIEERAGITLDDGVFEQMRTLGDLRRWLGVAPAAESYAPPMTAQARATESVPLTQFEAPPQSASQPSTESESYSASSKYLYPHWPWLLPIRWLRTAFIETLMRPLVWLLVNPRVVAPQSLRAEKPLLIVANHVTTYDVPLLQFALPGALRRSMAVAMSGEMLEDLRHFRNPERHIVIAKFYPLGPLVYALLTAFFNVFPLPRQRDFQRSFAHAGEALDHGLHVLVFPEGTRSQDGALAQFRTGIGLLVKESSAPVLPVAIQGLGELKSGRRSWLRSGTIRICIGEPINFAPDATESAVTARLHDEIDRLLNEKV